MQGLLELSTCARRARLLREDAEHMARFLMLPFVQGTARERLQAYISEQLNAADAADQLGRDALAAIMEIPDATDREIMLLRYRDGLTWDQVADAMHYCSGRVQQRHKRIMAQIRANSEQN